jgi:hypothetical protein
MTDFPVDFHDPDCPAHKQVQDQVVAVQNPALFQAIQAATRTFQTSPPPPES